MNKLEVGMYTRTIKGEIYKLCDDFILKYFQKEQERGIFEHQIIKTSFNIIDLIEVGDYVNGRIVDEYIYLDKIGLIGLNELEKEDDKFIKSIVTKEQFESMEYKLEIEKDK